MQRVGTLHHQVQTAEIEANVAEAEVHRDIGRTDALRGQAPTRNGRELRSAVRHSRELRSTVRHSRGFDCELGVHLWRLSHHHEVDDAPVLEDVGRSLIGGLSQQGAPIAIHACSNTELVPKRLVAVVV